MKPPEVIQAAGENGPHGPLTKKAHECVLHVVISSMDDQ